MNSAPVFGNYHGYYKKRPFVNDPRLAVLPSTTFSNARVLDVGCNEGFVTCEIAQSWGANEVVGVDIDESLIRQAWKRRRTVWSLQEPTLKYKGDLAAPIINGGKRQHEHDAATPEGADSLQTDYFPASCEHLFGPVPILPADIHSIEEKELFPHNVSFRAADWVNDTIPEDAGGYDVVVAFSISKWVHLNGGDEGLMQFFRRIHSVLRLGGKLVLEPQEWDTYAKAKRMDTRLKENAKALKLRPDHFESVLRDMGFDAVEHLGKVGEGGFRRPIEMYTKAK